MAGKFKIFLLRRGVKQFELAKACGWAESKVSRFANGHVDPTLEEIMMMAKALGMSRDKLMKAGGW